MIRAVTPKEKVQIRIDGEFSHLDCKAMGALFGRVSGRGKYVQVIRGQIVEVIVENEGTDGASYEAISDR